MKKIEIGKEIVYRDGKRLIMGTVLEIGINYIVVNATIATPLKGFKPGKYSVHKSIIDKVI